VDIPPLQYDSAYRLRLKLKGKSEIPLTADSLQRIDSAFAAKVNEIAVARDSPTAHEICRSLVAAIQSVFKDARIERPLMSCADDIDSNDDQIKAMQIRIADAINSRNKLVAARASSVPAATVSSAEAEVAKARQALRGTIREVVITNTYMPIDLGTAADAATTRAKHVSMDAGLAYAWDLDKSLTYLGANIYFRPINTDVSLSSLRAEGMLSWRHRLSLTLGTTLESIEKPGERKGIIGSNALVVGVGWRLTDVIRISAGALVFEEENPNPLVTNDTSLAVSPYVGLSFDVDIAKQFGKVFNGLH
jgi:hypothetical protein